MNTNQQGKTVKQEIILSRAGNSWFAWFSDLNEQIETAFTAQASKEQVVREIAQLNPGFEIRVVGV